MENDTVRCSDSTCPRATTCIRFLTRQDSTVAEPIELDAAICRLGDYQAHWPTAQPDKYKHLSIA